MEKRNFNEALKQRELREKEENARRSGENEMTLDDAARVKVLSPGMLVFKRFIRNKLAIVGSVILICMFLFAFIGPYFYRYGQTEVFNAYKLLNINYANAVERTDYTVYPVNDLGISTTTKNLFNSIIIDMEANEQSWTMLQDKGSGQNVVVEKQGENVYTMGVGENVNVGTFSFEQPVGKFNTRFGKMAYTGEAMDDKFEEAVAAAVAAGETQLTYKGTAYLIVQGAIDLERLVYSAEDGTMKYSGTDLGDGFTELVAENLLTGSFEEDGSIYTITVGEKGAFQVDGIQNIQTAFVSSTYVFDTMETGVALSEEFKVQALLNMYGEGKFTADGAEYTVFHDEGETYIRTADGSDFAAVSTFVVRRFNGEDTLDLEFKAQTREVVAQMEEQHLTSASFTYNLEQLDENGQPVMDENGKPVLVESELTVTDKVTDYVVVCEQYTYMLDRFAGPSDAHPLGTDGDGMDILARMMAGGRISLLVGFVVVILEIILGVIMGGLAGYFGGWVDNLIMRLVDIFYCIPSMPILIILGAMLDALRLDPYIRLMWLMAVLGFLGWASIARLVRGQILSLREQDFMVATEASGLPVSRRIFRHLIPNVMPQLIVTATMGLGSVILTESTLSFLGLGVKHPMATWGTMINSVATSAQAMITYTYIWIPVGLLICLTVVAFNFVGDGLRDAFDPKMKR